MTRARTNADQAPTESLSVEPHIIPGVLYPAVAGKLLDGSTSHSGAYGTAQADGYSYYYTDIKGSKPIKDPRIGGHFGSQRYKFTSLQLLEQETATEGKNIYSIDGREWLRAYTGNSEWINYYDQNGTYLQAPTDCTGNFIELTGYFNDINFAITTHSNRCDDIDISVNGTLSVDGSATLGGRTTVASPLGSRFVGMGSLINGGSTLSASLGTTPQINTVRYEMKTGSGEYVELHAIELIAQDTTSTATKSQIQIPSQNVVSYGKKFTVSGTPHYDPFNGFTNSSDLHSAYVDTATSLGLSSAPGSSASWAISSTNNIRPYNGMRVVKWVDSSGTIKTSVTAMPPNAQNIGTTASNEITTPSATNTTTTPNMSDDAVDHSLSEVAKTFHWREFGNGAANGGTGATYADASMLHTTSDDIAYVMDDGLTSLSGDDCRAASDQDLRPEDVNDFWYLTFIGTGVTIKTTTYAADTYHIAQNLPYGTHILKGFRDADTTPDYTLDGIAINDVAGGTYACASEFTFHQPKKPPIPEDAVVLADYMLMADFVPQTAHTEGIISKGVRRTSASRDFFYDHAHASAASSINVATHLDYSTIGPYTYLGNQAGLATQQLPFFGTSWTYRHHSLTNYMVTGGTTYTINGSDLSSYTLDADGGGGTSITSAGVLTKIDATDKDNYVSAVGGTLGVSVWKQTETTASGKYLYGGDLDVASPIHTSSHYSTFSTPYQDILVGGDRNIEQHSLIVTPDGKTWDQVTRDTSYLTNLVFSASRDGGNVTDTTFIYDWFRGTFEDNANSAVQKENWAIAYDRLICLIEGTYKISLINYFSGADGNLILQKNATGSGQATSLAYVRTDPADHAGTITVSHNFKRGDYITVYVGNTCRGDQTYMNNIQITKV